MAGRDRRTQHSYRRRERGEDEMMRNENEEDTEAGAADDTIEEDGGDCNDGDFVCKCSANCMAQFVIEDVDTHILTVKEMTKDEKEMYVMGLLREIGVDRQKTWRGDRKRKRYGYEFQNKKVCRSSFQYMYDIGKCSLTDLIRHMSLNGKVPRGHGNRGRSPHHALKYKEIKYCVDFLVNYSDQFGLPQPAAPRGRDGIAAVFLTASLTKDKLHKEYLQACQENSHAIRLTSFKQTWTQCIPHITIASPRDDVCQKCEQSRKKITDSVSEEDKIRTTTELQEHIQKAQKEQNLYKQSIIDSKTETPAERREGPIPPCSTDLWKVHYTFDYSQQVSIPHHARQMGPLYFLSFRKVQLFGVRLDGSSRQLNYLIDEDQSIGKTPLLSKLNEDAVPSIFPWTKECDQTLGRKSRAEARVARKRKIEDTIREELEASFTEDVQYVEENVEEEPDLFYASRLQMHATFTDQSTQTKTVPMFSIHNFENDDKAIHFYTGLESYSKFLFVLNTLGPAAYCLNYIHFHVTGISVEDQFFMTLIKLRRYLTNFELSRFFSMSEGKVKNIVCTWIIFMSRQWREVNIWPNQKLVRYFSPNDFKSKFPSTRVIIDGTECPIKKPKAPRAQQATFSTYKNKNTVKVLVGCTPGGLVNFVSQAFGGSASDRQIVERSNLVQSCDRYDSVMADKGFNVQDLFASKDISINVPTFFKKKNRMSCKTVIADRKISSKRLHIERLIGLGKTYKILKSNLNGTETKLSSDIIFVCFMLCNFRTGIVPGYA